MKKDDEEKSKNIHALHKIGISGRIRLKLRRAKREIKEDIDTLIHMDKKELISDIFSTRYFIVLLFVIILLKTLLFSADTVFYKEGIWLWYVRQTAFFIIIMVSPLLLFRNSRIRFAVRNGSKFFDKLAFICR